MVGNRNGSTIGTYPLEELNSARRAKCSYRLADGLRRSALASGFSSFLGMPSWFNRQSSAPLANRARQITA